MARVGQAFNMDLPAFVHDESLSGPAMAFMDYFKDVCEKAKKSAKTPAEDRQAETDAFAHAQNHLQEWMKKTGTTLETFMGIKKA